MLNNPLQALLYFAAEKAAIALKAPEIGRYKS